MKAYHITSKRNFDAILCDGFIRPRSQPRKFGEQGGGFSADWHAQDNQYVFFAPSEHSEFYRTLTDGTDAYGFVYDAEFLILGMDALVGPDLLSAYDALQHECAKEIAEELGPKPIDEKGLTEFLIRHEITDPEMISQMRRDESSYYHDVLYAMMDEDSSVPGASDALRLFKDRVGAIQDRDRVTGEEALAFLRAAPVWNLTPREILVPGQVSIEARLHCVIAGIEEGD